MTRVAVNGYCFCLNGRSMRRTEELDQTKIKLNLLTLPVAILQNKGNY